MAIYERKIFYNFRPAQEAKKARLLTKLNTFSQSLIGDMKGDH